MKTKTSSFLLLLLLIFCSVFLLNKYSKNTASQPETQLNETKQNQFLSMEKITLRRYNDSNKLSLLLTADNAEQINLDSPLELTNQSAESIEWLNGQKKILATLKSPYGQYASSAGTVYFCQLREVCNNNQLTEAKQKPYLVELVDLKTIPPTFIKSSALIYDINGKLVSNEHPTVITRGASTFSGTGLRANLVTHEYQLLHDVKTVLVPAPTIDQIKP